MNQIRRRLWTALEPWAKIALVGLVVSGVLAIVLASYIPREVEQRFLETKAESIVDLTSILVAVTTEYGEYGVDLGALESHVAQLSESGRFVRAKLWSLDGTILYSDEAGLIGQTFLPDEDFHSMTEAEWHISNLLVEENVFERDLGYERLLETYVPVFVDGEVTFIWEVYEPLDDFDEAIASVRVKVWTAVGSGLAILTGFLIVIFGGLVSSRERGRLQAEHRSSELESLLEIARLSAQTASPDTIARDVVEFLFSAPDILCACLVRFDGKGGKSRTLAQSGSPDSCGLRTPDEDIDIPTHPQAFGPTTSHVRREDYGLWICHTERAVNRTEAVLQAMLEETVIGIEKAQLHEELEANKAHVERIMQRLVDAQDEERRSTVAEIHDGLAQDLYRVLFGIRGCLTATEEVRHAELLRLERLIAASSRDLRTLLQQMHPTVVDDVGLGPSLRSLGQRIQAEYGIVIELELGRFDEPPYDKRMAIYRIVQEALINAAKHSGSDSVRVRIKQRPGMLSAGVQDQGRGIIDNSGDGLGIWVMRERAESQGGSLKIETGEHGTTIEAWIPLEVGEDGPH